MLTENCRIVIANVAKQTGILYFWFASGFALAMTIKYNSLIRKGNIFFRKQLYP
jgi:hypothetical protein